MTMPLRKLTARVRSRESNFRLAVLLSFAAGVVDVSGYLRLHQFTSHMTGITASLAARFDAASHLAVYQSLVVLFSFIWGAAVCALLVNFSRRRNLESQFALPLLLEAISLAVVPLTVHEVWMMPKATLGILAFAMGLQNAIITKISDAEIRTTHVTGMVTDIGIELGRALYWNRGRSDEPVRLHRERFTTLVLLVFSFFTGGASAAVSFPHLDLDFYYPSLSC